jgi:RNA polymerase sigma-70 factor (ECF subfamily)
MHAERFEQPGATNAKRLGRSAVRFATRSPAVGQNRGVDLSLGRIEAARAVIDPVFLLVLRDVLGFRAAEVADMLGGSEAAVKGALQRARATLQTRLPGRDEKRAPPPHSGLERALVGRFADALEQGDVAGIVSLLSDDAWLTMPPYPFEYQGHAAIAGFLRDRARLTGAPLRLVPTRANGQPAFGCYLPDAHTAVAHPYGLMVLTLEADRVSAITWFGDTALLSRFGLPRTLPA